MAEQLKNIFFTTDSMNAMADTIQQFYPLFNKDNFRNRIYSPDWERLELKEKMRHTTECLHETLPPSFQEAITILKKAAPFIKGFEAMSLPDFVELYGLTENWDLCFEAMALFTCYSSSEFAVRPFLDRDPEKALAYLLNFAEHENPRIRRWASEGCRPRLPWAMALPKFKKDPTPLLPILDKLKNDTSDDVRRSVANNLNDISKDNPELLLQISKQWYGITENTNNIIKHACRTLMKSGNTDALNFFGFKKTYNITIDNLLIDKTTLSIGETLCFSFEMVLREPQETCIRLEYGVYYMKSNRKPSKKVFKITEKTYRPGKHTFNRKHPFQHASTRTLYPGEHKIAIIVNGQEQEEITFLLV